MTTLRRCSSPLCALVAGLALVLTGLVLASPAQAAPVVDLQAASTTVAVGEPIELSWTSTDDDPDADPVPLTPTGDWPDDAAKTPNGSEDVPATTPGTLTFTLTADDGDPTTLNDPTDTVTVVVTAAVDPAVEVTPAAPVSEDCTFTIPEQEGVAFSVDIDLETIPLEPDTYPTFAFSDDDGIVTIIATVDDGFVLADGAQTTFQIQESDDCLDFEGADVVDVSAACERVTFTNTSDTALTVFYGDDETDDELTLAVGATRTVESLSGTTAYLAYDASFGDFDDVIDSDDLDDLFDLLAATEFGEISVPQGCVTGSSHPTVAPAAGI